MLNMNFIRKSKDLHQKHPNILIAVFFISGFLFDIFTLGQVDEFGNFVGHSIYLSMLILAFLSIDKEYKRGFTQKLSIYQKDIFHFLAGGLLSGFAIFFFKSSSLSTSGIFILLILLLLLANESPKFQERGMLIKLSLVQFCISAYFIIYIPVLVGVMNVSVFLLTLAVATVVLPIVLNRLNHPAKNESKLIAFALSIFLIVGYFSNLLPPVPLSVKKIGVYQNIEKQGDDYHLYREKSFYDYFGLQSTNFNFLPGDKVYVFARIFAPRGLKDKLYIQWEKWDKRWKVSDRISLTIKGGNSWGYRAYTYKQNYTPGLWRAKVMSSDNREISRIDFTITPSTSDKRELIKEIEN